MGPERLSSQTLRGIVCRAALWLSACGSTTFTSPWKAPHSQRVDPIGKSIAALVISSDQERRRDADIHLAHEISIRGVQGVAAYTLIGLDHPNADYATSRFKEAGVEGVEVMRLVSHDQSVIVGPLLGKRLWVIRIVLLVVWDSVNLFDRVGSNRHSSHD